MRHFVISYRVFPAHSFMPCSERIHVAVTEMAALFPKVWESYFELKRPCCRNAEIFHINKTACPPSSAEAALWHGERIPAFVDLERLSASERVQEGGAVRGLPGTGHAAGHPAGHPVCLWHRQGCQAARHRHHQGEYQLMALSGRQSHQRLRSFRTC